MLRWAKPPSGWLWAASSLLLALSTAVSPLRALGAAIFADAGQGRHLGEGQGHGHAHGDEDRHGEERGRGHGRFGFSSHEREAILGYYRGPRRGLPPGLAKRGGNLPPGLEKHLVRDGTLPPGLEKRLAPLPVELERQLPPLPPDCGCRRGIIGASVLLVRNGDGRILDLFQVVIGR